MIGAGVKRGVLSTYRWAVPAVIALGVCVALLRPLESWAWSTFIEPITHPFPLLLGMLLDATTVTVLALVVLWSAISARNWTLRAFILVVTPLVVLLIGAHELVIRFACFQLVLAAGVWILASRRRAVLAECSLIRRSRQLSLSALLFLMFLVAVACGLVSEPLASGFTALEGETIGYNAIQGTMGGMIVLLGVWSFLFSRDHWFVRCCFVACGLATFTAPIALTYDMRYGLGLCDGYQQRVFVMSGDQSRLDHGLAWWSYWVMFSLLSLGILWLVLDSGKKSGWLKHWPAGTAGLMQRENSTRARVWFVMLLIATSGLPTFVFLCVLFLPHVPDAFLPQPNGYDQLVRAGESVDVSIDFDPAAPTCPAVDANREALTAFVEQASSQLNMMQDAFQLPSAVPVGYGERMLDSPKPFISLVLLLNSKARLAELEHDTKLLLQSRLQRLWLCQQLTRGATEHEFFLASDILGYPSMLASIDNFDANACRRFAQEVRAVETNREPLKDILRRDYLLHAHMGWFVRVNQIMEQLTGKTRHDLIVRRGYQMFEFRLRRLMLVAALRAYTLDKGNLPIELDQLVPEYLHAVPRDPFVPGEQPIDCKLTSNGFRIVASSPLYGDQLADFKLDEKRGGTVVLKVSGR